MQAEQECCAEQENSKSAQAAARWQEMRKHTLKYDHADGWVGLSG